MEELDRRKQGVLEVVEDVEVVEELVEEVEELVEEVVVFVVELVEEVVELVVELVEDVVELVELVELLVDEVEDVEDVVEVVPQTALSINKPSSKQSEYFIALPKGRVDEPDCTGSNAPVLTVALNL